MTHWHKRLIVCSYRLRFYHWKKQFAFYVNVSYSQIIE